MDQADIADQLIAEHLEKAIAAARGIQSSSHTRESEKHCIECGEQIPELRRKVITGCTRCVSCEEDAESRDRANPRKTGQANHDDNLIDDALFMPAMT